MISWVETNAQDTDTTANWKDEENRKSMTITSIHEQVEEIG